jgi:predicted DNA-binding transcriptional regulator AlpA
MATMGAADVIPWREQAVGAAEACKLFGLSPEWFLRTVACRPGFPAKVHGRPARWVLGEVLDYRDAHRGDLAA